MIDFSNCLRINTTTLPNTPNNQFKLVIFWDTCALLDIYNECIKINNGQHINVLHKILEKTNNNEIINFSSELIEIEFKDNIETVKKLHQTKINDIESTYNNLSAISNKLSHYDAKTINRHDPELNFLDDLDSLLQNLINKIILIEKNNFIYDATERHLQKVAPGHHGFKDCIFWLQALEIRRCIGMASTFYFITSNIKDYYVRKNNIDIIHQDIVPESIERKIYFINKIVELTKSISEA